MSEPMPIELPPDLKARLDAAGVKDDASLQRALEADPALKRDFEAFIQASSERLIGALVDGLQTLPGDEALGEFWRQVPLALEEAFLATAEARAAQIEQEDNSALAAALRERLAILRQVRAEQQAIASRPEAQRFQRSLEHHFELCRAASEKPSIEN